MKKEKIIIKLDAMGATKLTENVWTLNGHYFQIHKNNDGTYDLIEL